MLGALRHLAPVAALWLALALAACGGESSPEPGGADTVAGKLRPKPAKPGKPKVEVPSGPPPKQLVVKDVWKGTGQVLEDPGDQLVVNYVGVAYETGKEFYSTWDRGGPSRFLLEEVHEGWERGLKGMRVGGRRELIEPSRLAYKTGPLIYVVDLIAVKKAAGTDSDSSGASAAVPRKAGSSSPRAIGRRRQPRVEVPSGPPPKELVVENAIEGIGAVAKEGDRLAVRYVAVDYKTGRLHENSWRLTFRFELGAGEVNDGWEEGLAGMRVGGRRKLIVPAELGPYGADALIYVVDLLSAR